MEGDTAQEMERSYNPMEFYREVRELLDNYYPKDEYNVDAFYLRTIFFLNELVNVVNKEIKKIPKKEKAEVSKSLKSALTIIGNFAAVDGLVRRIYSLKEGYEQKNEIDEVIKKHTNMLEEMRIYDLLKEANNYKTKFWESINRKDREEIINYIANELKLGEILPIRALIIGGFFLPDKFHLYDNIIIPKLEKMEEKLHKLDEKENYYLIKKINEMLKKVITPYEKISLPKFLETLTKELSPEEKEEK